MKIKFSSSLILIGLISSVLLTMATAQRTPTFAPYSVPVEKATAKKINFASHPKAKKFRTELSEALETGQVDFAGKYIVASWGCGSGCTQSALIDATTGNVYFPVNLWEVIAGGMAAGERDLLEYKENSRLMIITGYQRKRKQDSTMSMHGVSFYEWTGRDFKLLKFIKRPVKKY